MQEIQKRPFSNRDLVRLMIPLIIEQFLAVTVGMADSMMVASLGEAAVSSVSLVDTVNVLLASLFASLATGGAIVTGQFLGSRNLERAQRSAEQLILFLAVLAVLVTAAMYCLRNAILYGLFGAVEADVAANAEAYFNYVEISIPFLAVYSAGAALFRIMGNSSISMWISLIMNLINVSGNAILIFGAKWGVAGVAVPTLVSRMFAAVAIMWLLRNKDLQIHLSGRFRFRFDGKTIGQIVRTGVPNGIEGSMFQLGKILLVSVVATFGTASITANAIGNTLVTFQNLPGTATSLALPTVVSQCVGQKDYDSVHYYTKKLLKFAYLGMLLFNVVIMLILPGILTVYQVSEATRQLATNLILSYSVVCVIVWPLSFSFPNTLRAAGDTRFVMAISVASMWMFRLVLGVLLAKQFAMGLAGVWIAMYVDWVVRAVLFLLRYRSGKWKEKAIKQ